jgi:pilus assembly protein TadC
LITAIAVSFLSAISFYFRKPLPRIGKVASKKPNSNLKQIQVQSISETRAVIDLLILTISAGMTIPSAISMISQTSKTYLAAQLNQALLSQNMGGSFEKEFLDLANQDRYWKLLIGQLKQSWDQGAMILDNLIDLSYFLLDIERSQTMQKVRSAGVKSVLPLGICFLPAFILVVVIPLVVSFINF